MVGCSSKWFLWPRGRSYLSEPQNRRALVGWIESLLESRIIRTVGSAFNRAFRLPNPISLKVGDSKLYAQTLDRIIALFAIKLGRWEQGERNYVRKIIQTNNVVVDVGANLGQYTLLFSKLVGNEGTVFSFEPAPENYRLLQMAIEANRCTNVVANELAVSDVSGWADLHISELHHGDHRIIEPKGKRKAIRVRSVSLDDQLSEEARIDLIKIDVQGAEPLVFRGMRQIIQKHPELTILTEFSPLHLGTANIEPSEFLEEIRDLGLQTSLLDRNGDLRLLDDPLQTLADSTDPSTLVLTSR